MGKYIEAEKVLAILDKKLARRKEEREILKDHPNYVRESNLVIYELNCIKESIEDQLLPDAVEIDPENK
jgi:hypothetical protein